MNISETIILGVVSGIVTSALIFLLVKVFYKIIIPWYQDILYSGINLSGQWEEVTKYSRYTDHMKFNISQKNNKITGLASLVKVNNTTQEAKSKILIITGKFQNGYLILTLENQDKRMQTLLTYLLKVNNGGELLAGNVTWVDVGTNNIKTAETQLKRLNV